MRGEKSRATPRACGLACSTRSNNRPSPEPRSRTRRTFRGISSSNAASPAERCGRLSARSRYAEAWSADCHSLIKRLASWRPGPPGDGDELLAADRRFRDRHADHLIPGRSHLEQLLLQRAGLRGRHQLVLERLDGRVLVALEDAHHFVAPEDGLEHGLAAILEACIRRLLQLLLHRRGLRR